MKILLDTHALLWIIMDDDRLSNVSREVFLDTNNSLYFSIISLWEICIKRSLNKLTLKDGWLQLIQKEMKNNSIQWLPVEINHCVKIGELPFLHRDPFDRMLIAQAMSENLSILTRDSRFSDYEINCIW